MLYLDFNSEYGYGQVYSTGRHCSLGATTSLTHTTSISDSRVFGSGTTLQRRSGILLRQRTAAGQRYGAIGRLRTLARFRQLFKGMRCVHIPANARRTSSRHNFREREAWRFVSVSSARGILDRAEAARTLAQQLGARLTR